MATSTPTADRLQRWERAADIPLTVLAAVFLGVYSWQVLDTGPSPRLDFWLTAVDVLVWVVFAVDFGVRLRLSTHRWQFVKQNPLDLLFVLLPPFRPLRLLRAAMILLDTLHRHTLTRARLSVFIGASSILMLYLCNLAIYDAEYGVEDSNIHNFGDALWWSMVSVTTVGYGDFYPVTTEGRLVALVLMTFGIGLISFAIGTTTSWVINKLKTVEESADRTDREIGKLVEELRALRTEVTALRESRTVAGGQLANEQRGVQ